VTFYQLKQEIDMKAFDVGGWCNYCSILLTDIPFETVKAEVRETERGGGPRSTLTFPGPPPQVAALEQGKVERWQTVLGRVR